MKRLFVVCQLYSHWSIGAVIGSTLQAGTWTLLASFFVGTYILSQVAGFVILTIQKREAQ